MKKALLAVSGLALIVTVSACGSRPESGQASPPASDTLFGNAQELVRAATAKTGQAQSAKFTLTETVGNEMVTAHGEGRFGTNAAMDLTMKVQGEEVEMRFVDKTFYIKVPPEQMEATGGKPWGRISADNELGKVLGSLANTAEQNDPAKILDQIQQAGTITKSEKTTLDGQPASHYWVDIDFAKAAASFAESSGLPPEELQKLAGDKIKTIPVELWLNQDSLPVQITEDITPILKAAGGPEAGQSANIIMKYSDWGAPVDVQAPPADQVADLDLGLN
ncbi:hypothetical protein [Amycolatopsis taiwanensis]|uniref:LppX_LprAFG lipoprotein n=1 Tax=Amycolatopsis taiwanensis TaxID=342230 RepID=A0A9W6QUX6_9PSEU|nr:hypothetical protein [Amycolatopsis taiwanensis]GLY64496.1 hypothetical protein Atai01_11150 [Amycolatopsis taiwanensis]